MAESEKLMQARIDALLLRLRLFKAPIALMTMAASLAGSAAFLERVTRASLAAALGAGLVAAGALALNNIQDRNIDRVMARTRGRALAAGRVKVSEALVMSLLFVILGGAILLYAGTSTRAFFASMAAIVLYNIFYTPLKRKTSLALIPGVACGAMPVYIGWAAAGGPAISGKILFLTALMAVWQVPHTWITGLSRTEDLEKAGIRATVSCHRTTVMLKLIFLWAATFAVATMHLPLFGIRVSPSSMALIILDALLVIGIFACLAFTKYRLGRDRIMFSCLNLSLLILLAIIIAERIPMPGVLASIH